MSTLRVNNIEKLTSNKLFIKSDTNLSGSLQLTGSLEVTGQISGSFYGDGSNLLGVTSYTDSDTLSYINSLGVLSGSIDWNTLEGKPSGIVSSSAQLSTEISGAFVSTSASLASSISNNDSRLTTLEGKTLISSSIQLSNQTIPGNLTVGGILTAQEFHTEFVSASIIYDSGSTKFGDSADDVHSFTGSLNLLGTLSATTIKNVVSSSSQVSFTGITDKPTLVSGSSQISFTTISDKPTLVSGSSQIVYNSISNIPTGIISGSGQIDFFSIPNKPTLVSGSAQIIYNSISSIPTGIISGSAQISSLGFTTCVGDITGVTAGTGLGGGGTSGDVTLSVNADQRGNVTLIGPNTNDFIYVQGTVIDFYLDGALDMRLENDGDLHVDGNVIAYSTTTSDERLKDNIETLDNSLEKIKNIRGVSYTWKKGGREGQKDIGVIAQEIEKVFPELVREVKLPTLDIEDTTKYKTVDYDKLSPILIEAIKELSNRLECLENKLDKNGITK